MRCPECAADVDPLREFCTHCGAPTRSSLSERLRSGPSGPPGRPPEELKQNRKTVLIVGAGLLVLLGVAGKLNPFGHHLSFSPGVMRIDTQADKGPKGPVTIGAEQFYLAYRSDPDGAEKKFGGREMVVSGTFVRTVPDGYGSIDMRLKTANPEQPLGVDLDGVSVDAATKLEPGQNVTVSCRRVARTGDERWLQDCVIQPPGEGAAAPAAPAAPSPPPAPSAGNSG